jgi:ketosteroid isomerase-like protein
MNLRNLFLLVFTAALFSSSLPAQSIWKEAKNHTWKTATGAEQYERLLWRAVKDKDWLAVESHISSNFVYMDPTGTKDKAQHVSDLKSMELNDVKIDDVNVTAQGTDAIVTYTLSRKTASRDIPAVRIMSVWRQQKSGWVLVAMSETGLAELPKM